MSNVSEFEVRASWKRQLTNSMSYTPSGKLSPGKKSVRPADGETAGLAKIVADISQLEDRKTTHLDTGVQITPFTEQFKKSVND